jgi:fluoroacetyl-CoA thioesterase
MKNIFKKGDQKVYTKTVRAEDLAAFHGDLVHPVFSTFSLARDIEWTTRLFVLETRDDDEEGVGTFITIEHKSPAWEGEEIIFKASIEQCEGHELICSVEVTVGQRIIALGKTGQKILKREKIKKIFQRV